MSLLNRAKRKIQYELKQRLGIGLTTPGVYRPPLDVAVSKETLGSDYGDWTFCSDGLNQNSVIYSVGVGEDISWDVTLIERYSVQVYAFDPTPRSIQWVAQQGTPPQFNFYAYGIAAHDGMIRFYPPENPEHVSHTILHRPETAAGVIEVPVKRLESIADELGHERIDILKMDIEGAEYSVLDDVIQCGLPIRQILVEFHHRFAQVSIKETIRTVRRLQQHGYDLFHVSDTAEEFSFIRE